MTMENKMDNNTYNTRTAEFGPVEFVMKGDYIWLRYGTTEQQICYGGDFRGSTVQCGDLKTQAQRWLRQRRDWMRKA